VIVQVGSALAYRGIPMQAPYCAAKHAVQGFMDSLRSELLHDGSRVQVTMVQLPALNTPQFGWVKSRLPRKAQPVPPIYQPEVAADAIAYAARHPRREFWVGMPTVVAIAGNRVAPGVGDHYLARTGVESQMTDEPEDPNRPNNLWEPLPGDAGAHGTFGARASSSSLEVAMMKRRPLITAMGLLAAGVTLAFRLR
jgi:NAD(P)-dependent dehydrogenase (short-subunit alcohol dehydrogenase family)